jgi:hypothetical protein
LWGDYGPTALGKGLPEEIFGQHGYLGGTKKPAERRATQQQCERYGRGAVL